MVDKIIIIACVLLLLTYLILFLFFLFTMYGDESKHFFVQPGFLKPFFSIAVLLRKSSAAKSNKSTARIQKQVQMKKQFKIINPSEAASVQWERFECERLSWILLSFFVGIAFCLILTISNVMTPILQEGNTLERREYGMGKIGRAHV